jgi:sec-independent protein translocase protein TatA
MGLSGISPGSLILIFLIVVLLFGTKKLQSLGEDLGKALKGFRKGMKDVQEDPESKKTDV